MNNKGISDTIAILLLIVVAVAASVILYMWITGYNLPSQSQEEALQSMLKIEAVEVEDDKLKVYVRNIGEFRVQIDTIYILSLSQTIITKLTPFEAPVEIEPGELAILVATSPVELDGNYLIQIESTKGVMSVFRAKIALKAKPVVLNEVEGNPPGVDRLGIEWIEIYNPSNQPFNLAGYEIWDSENHRLCTIGVDCVTRPDSTIIQPKSYMIVTGWTGYLIDNYDPDGVVLKDPRGKVVDESPLFADSWSTAESMQRIPNGYGDWTFSLSTKGFANQLVKLYINEYEANPTGNDWNDEWVEIYNPNDFTIELSNLRVYNYDGNYRTISYSSFVPPHSYYVFTILGAMFTNDADGAILRSPYPGGRIYDDTGLLTDGEDNNKTWQRVPDGSKNWVFKEATKGASNG